MKKKFKFIDLFAGIGGTRLAFEDAGGKCVFSSEWDKYSQKTYEINHGEKPSGDIRKIKPEEIEDFDVLVAGFPCQPFSIAGVSKKKSLGRKHGFDDEEQGNLFFEIARILKVKKPPVILLENVKNLKNHDRGNTYKTIHEILDTLGYAIFAKIIDARHYVPQHRERIFIVGFRKDVFPGVEFKFPDPPGECPSVKKILDKNIDGKYTLSDHLWKYLKNYAEKHRKKGNGFGYGLIDPSKHKTTRTLSARYYKDGSEILIRQNGKNPRRLSPKECSRLMGFPATFKIPVSDTQAYRQFGNSVAVPVVSAIAKKMVQTMRRHGQADKRT